jgi:hypothetical protein
MTCRGSNSSANEGVGPLRAGVTDILMVLVVVLTSAGLGDQAKDETSMEE